MTFSMVIPRRPPSAAKNLKPGFQDAMRTAAAVHLKTDQILAGEMYGRITWFHAVPTTQDVDNITKRIIDSLKGVVFDDDFLIVQCLATRIDMRRNFAIVNPDVAGEVYQELISLLGENHDHVLYVEVGLIENQRLVFGPIDGVSR